MDMMTTKFSQQADRQGLFLALAKYAVIAWCALSLQFDSATADEGAVATVLEPNYNFGTVSQGQRVEHEFAVRNDGDADLVIQRVAPSCGCTAAAMSASAIKPGTSEKIKVTFNTAGFYGAKTKTVSVLTNARNQAELVLKVQGTIERHVIVSPERLDFGDIGSDTSQPLRTREFTVEVVEGVDKQVADVRSVSKFLSVQAQGTQGRAQKYSVVLLPGAPRGELRDRVLVEFKNPDHSAINVPVNASVLGDVRLTPSTVSFGIINGDQKIERRVRFENNSAQSVVIQEVKSSHPAVAATVLPVAEGRRSVIVITVDPKKITTDLQTSLEVTTSHPEEKAIALNVFGVLPQK